MQLSPTLQTTTIENVHSFQSGENGVYFISVDKRNGGFVKVEKTDVISVLHHWTPKFSSVSQCGRGKTLRKLQCRRQFNRKRVLLNQCEGGVINAMSTVYARVGVGNFFLHFAGWRWKLNVERLQDMECPEKQSLKMLFMHKKKTIKIFYDMYFNYTVWNTKISVPISQTVLIYVCCRSRYNSDFSWRFRPCDDQS